MPGSFPDVQLYTKPVPKGKCGFLREKSQKKNKNEIHIQNRMRKYIFVCDAKQKGPAEAEPEIFSAKTQTDIEWIATLA